MRDDRLENWYLNLSDFQAFDDIKSLDLTDNSIAGFVENKGNVRFSWQRKLEGLVLSDNQLTNDIISFLSGFHHLKSLDLSYNELEGSLDISEFGDLEKLEHLELDGSFNIGNKFFESIGALTSLKVLSLSSCGIKGSLPIAGWIKLKKLEEFDISNNELEGQLGLSFINMTSLRKLDFSNNSFTGNFASSLATLTSLIFLAISLNKFPGNFPNWLLENNTKIVSLDLGNCSFTGHFRLPSHVNPYLGTIIASYNMIIGQLPSNISTIFPNLEHLEMSANAMNGSLPPLFGQNLWTLDLSDNNFSGEMPRNISVHVSLLEILKLSNNKLVGSVCPTLVNLKILRELFLDGNSFSSSIPSCLFNASFLLVMDISNNHFVGKLPNDGIRNLSNLQALSIARNHLEGSISTEIIEQRSLKYLDLSRNDLSESIPSFAHSKVRYVLLNNNRFSGFATTMFNRSLPLIMLDLSNNNITGKI
ncbi:hypothetical protein L6164_033374 [Bauhinia variegata]|uniref:Uncharacterized protein n=1 Tax=Bauhinia variegata TaxID=167791 RepID=A0ACB9KRR1_BAUVA|nr:hypothetical protein L6164_033374 [Bauhinia variegata]